jgi:hypothetical protein
MAPKIASARKPTQLAKAEIVELVGAGTVVGFVPPRLSFGSQKVGSKSAPQQLQMTNQSGSPLTVSSIVASGNDGTEFAETNTCLASLAAGTSRTITVTFDPRKTGLLNAPVSVSDSDGGSPQSALLRGTGD